MNRLYDSTPCYIPATSTTSRTVQISQQEYAAFRTFLEEACGIMLGDNKHYLVTSRLSRVMRDFGITDLGELMGRMRAQPGGKLRESVIDAMTTNETQWFRDGYPFEVLSRFILPEFAQKRPKQLRIWSAASSSGQEAYSISITLQEFLLTRPGALPPLLQVIGTDISPSMLREANSASYDRMALDRGLAPERMRWFTQKGDRWEVKPEIRGRVTFRELNLLQSYASLGKFEVVFCRNVLIYFSSAVKRNILERIAQVLNPGGYLFLGGSESPTSYTDAFEIVRTPQGVVYRVKPASAKS